MSGENQAIMAIKKQDVQPDRPAKMLNGWPDWLSTPRIPSKTCAAGLAQATASARPEGQSIG